jgi:hypothetical protein
MTEAELVKVLLNNGFMAIFVLWVLFRGEPKYREVVIKLNANNAAVMKAMSEDFRRTLEDMRRTFSETIDLVSGKFESIIGNLHRECREERAELMRQMVANDDKDRDARHKQGQLLQQAVIEMHELQQQAGKSNADRR